MTTITRDEIKGSYSERLVTDICFKVAQTGDFVGFIQQYLYDEDEQITRNAISALTKATDAELAQLKPIMNELIDTAMKTASPSIRRPLLGIIERQKITAEDIRPDFLDYCLDRMLSHDEVPSIQALSMKLAHKMCSFYPELQEELHRTLKAMEIDYYPPAVKSVRRKILAST